MATLDDLLIKRRRGALAAGEEHRLDSALRASREYELALLAQDVFDRDGAPRAGDAERLRDLARSVERRLLPAPPAPRAWRIRYLVAAAALVAGVAAASIGFQHAAPIELAPNRPSPNAPAPAPRAAPPLPMAAPIEPVPSAPPPSPAPVPPPIAAPSLHPPAPLAPEPRREQSPQRSSLGSRSASSAARAATPRLPPIPPPATKPLHLLGASPPRAIASGEDAESARTLFRRANALRQNDWPGAAALYTEVIRRHPSSNEAGISEIALGKWSLSQGRSGDALDWFRAYQRRLPGALTAEALFGEARALESIGSHAAARRPWRRLLDDYPESAYANVARQRLGP